MRPTCLPITVTLCLALATFSDRALLLSAERPAKPAVAQQNAGFQIEVRAPRDNDGPQRQAAPSARWRLPVRRAGQPRPAHPSDAVQQETALFQTVVTRTAVQTRPSPVVMPAAGQSHDDLPPGENGSAMMLDRAAQPVIAPGRRKKTIAGPQASPTSGEEQPAFGIQIVPAPLLPLRDADRAGNR